MWKGRKLVPNEGTEPLKTWARNKRVLPAAQRQGKLDSEEKDKCLESGHRLQFLKFRDLQLPADSSGNSVPVQSQELKPWMVSRPPSFQLGAADGQVSCCTAIFVSHCQSSPTNTENQCPLAICDCKPFLQMPDSFPSFCRMTEHNFCHRKLVTKPLSACVSSLGRM